MIIGIRFASVYLWYGLLSLCGEKTFTFKEITFIAYSGLPKGAICYGLMLEMTEMGVFCDPDENGHHVHECTV
jgi:hypothetical protein